jgi:predicted phosphodiesterase
MSDPIRFPRIHASTRRTFLQQGSLWLAGMGVANHWARDLVAASGANDDATEVMGGVVCRLGLVTDMHYADKEPSGSRHYRDSLAKLTQAAETYQNEQLDAVVELGDFIDAADSVETELGYLRRIDREFKRLSERTHYVLGNHCVYTLTKSEFLEAVGQTESFYSFDVGHAHFIVLDACFRADGENYGRKNFDWKDPNLSAEQLDFLKADLEKTRHPTVVFVHQRLDVSNAYGIKNAAVARKILEDSGKVAVVFQGHSHQNEHRELNGVHYCTLAAMVEGPAAEKNAYSTLTRYEKGTLKVTGFARQSSYTW